MFNHFLTAISQRQGTTEEPRKFFLLVPLSVTQEGSNLKLRLRTWEEQFQKGSRFIRGLYLHGILFPFYFQFVKGKSVVVFRLDLRVVNYTDTE